MCLQYLDSLILAILVSNSENRCPKIFQVSEWITRIHNWKITSPGIIMTQEVLGSAVTMPTYHNQSHKRSQEDGCQYPNGYNHNSLHWCSWWTRKMNGQFNSKMSSETLLPGLKLNKMKSCWLNIPEIMKHLAFRVFFFKKIETQCNWKDTEEFCVKQCE